MTRRELALRERKPSNTTTTRPQGPGAERAKYHTSADEELHVRQLRGERPNKICSLCATIARNYYRTRVTIDTASISNDGSSRRIFRRPFGCFIIETDENKRRQRTIRRYDFMIPTAVTDNVTLTAR